MATNYLSATGIIQSVTDMANDCCNKMVSILTETGIVNMVVTPDTYVVNNLRLRRGMSVSAFYDADAPAILIFPPQFRAEVIAQKSPQEMVTIQRFDDNLVSLDNSLQLNIGPQTMVTTTNGQPFTCDLGNRQLMVYYSNTTRSIPPQTTPRRVIVFCEE